MTHILKRLCILVLITITSSAVFAQQWDPSEETLLILKSDSRSDLLATVDALEAAGAHAAHVIPPKSIIAFVPYEVEDRVRALGNVAEVHRGMVTAVDGMEEGVDKALGAWNYMKNPLVQAADQSEVYIPNDIRYPDDRGTTVSGIRVTAAPGTYQTSEFMIGKVAVGVILPESTGSGENWSTSRQDQIFNEIVTGMNWWVTKGGAKAHLTFYYEKRFSVPTQYEPITMSGMADEATWVSDVLGNMGYTSGDASTRTRNYANYLRTTYGTDWAFSFIVCDSLNDTDGKFNDGYFAWAYLGGPHSIMTYDNNGYGISGMDTVARHETGHIFLAGDEYCSPGYACCNFSYYGYLNVYNGNCEDGNPSSVNCVMKRNSDAICTYTNGQIGWRDTDGDNICDPVDNVVNLVVSSVSSPDAEKRVTFTGSANDVAYDSPTRTDVTINTITTVRYRIDGGSWLTASVTDGQFDEDIENFTFTTPPLSAIPHLVEVEAVSSSGNVSETYTRNLLPPASIRVDDSAQGPVHDGTTWETAYKTIIEALTAAKAGDEVWVAQGVYNERISLKSGVGIYGGFAGSETLRSGRNPEVYASVIDGSAGGVVITIPAGTDAYAVIDGFTVRNGQSSYGGGVYCGSQASATISNNTITSNNATYGAGIYSTGSYVKITGNTISNNTSTSNGTGIYCSGGGLPVISSNVITGNYSSNNAAGIYCNGSSPGISRNSLINNTATNTGGAIYCYSASPVIDSNVIAGNVAKNAAGAYCYQYRGTMTNNTLIGNTLSGTVTQGAALYMASCTSTLANNIIAYNSSGIYNTSGTQSLRGNNVFGNTNNNYLGLSAGASDISQPPLFEDQSGGNYRLTADSPCIDSGSNGDASGLDRDNLIRPQDGNGDKYVATDIGAYEYPVDFQAVRRDYLHGDSTAFGGVVVSAMFPAQQMVYVQDSNRIGGIRVNTFESLTEGLVVNVMGTVSTDPTTGEHYINASSGYPKATGGPAAVRPMGMKVESLAGSSSATATTDNSGLLVKIWGRVCGLGPGDYVFIGDMFGINARLEMPEGAPAVHLGDFLIVTGVNTGISASGSAVIRASKASDIIVLM